MRPTRFILVAVVLAAPALALIPRSSSPSAAPRIVEVTALDYAFRVPRELPAGLTVFRFANQGRVLHEVNIVLLRPGVSIDTLLAALRTKRSSRPFVEGPVGVLIAAPGQRSGAGLSTELLPNRDYAVICIFSDSSGTPQHFAMGMYSVIHVLPRGATARAETRRVDTIVGMDYAYRYPATLPPGPRTFAFRNAGTVRHEMLVVGLKPGIGLDSVLKVDAAGDDISALIGEDFGVLHVPAGQQAMGMLDMNLVRGHTYTFLCLFTDSAGAPPHARLGMLGSIRVDR